VPTAASSRPKRNKGTKKSLNDDTLVLPSDVDSDQSHYSPSGSEYAEAYVSTEYESSEEEGKAIKNLATDMMEQPVNDERPFKKTNKQIKQKPRDTDK
jgi:hypothetical protein